MIEFKAAVQKAQAPESILGKGLRDSLFAALAVGVVALLQQVDTIDFGQYNALVSALVMLAITLTNRLTREEN